MAKKDHQLSCPQLSAGLKKTCCDGQNSGTLLPGLPELPVCGECRHQQLPLCGNHIMSCFVFVESDIVSNACVFVSERERERERELSLIHI